MFDVALKALPAWLFTGTPLYISHQSGLWYPHQKVPLRQQLKRWVANHMASGQLACSTFIAGYYRHCKVVYNPFRHDVFFASPDTPKAPVLLFAGRLVTVKGADLLLEAFALLQQHAVAAPLELHIAGHGPALMELQQQARELGIAHKVKWLGMLTQTRLAQVMRTARCMVVPSRLEPMGMVAVEGMASGLTMVLSRQGGLPEVGGAFCHYFEPHRPVDLCRALLNALTQGTLGSPLALAQHLQQFTVAHSVCGLQSALMLSAGTLPE
jgi:glycosyltransferase involved in cell wall biosynthesis